METGTEGPPEGEERRSIDTPGEQPSPSRNSPSKREIRILVGLILVTLGVAIFLDHAEGNTRALRILGDWWPVSIIAWGLVNVLRLIERRWMLGGPLSAILLGGLLLVWTLDNQTGRWLMAFLWPTAIVLVGFWLVLAAVESGEHRSTHSDELRRAVWFRGMYLTQGAQSLRRANITVLFGTLELDLRESDF